jgi:hypothetical protein
MEVFGWLVAPRPVSIQPAGARHSAGRVRKILRGQLIVDGDTWLGREGMGEFLKRGESGRL